MEQLTPGIYKHFKGNLYFVLGLAYDREDPTNLDKAEVIYHPLYPVENMGWRRGISPGKFLEKINDNDLQIDRFVKIIDWISPAILPGRNVRRASHFVYLPGQIDRVALGPEGEVRVYINWDKHDSNMPESYDFTSFLMHVVFL